MKRAILEAFLESEERDVQESREQVVRLKPWRKTIFYLVLPHLFPGHYDGDVELAFRTYLALNGTCRRLRYWNFLRRWIGWLCPAGRREVLRAHSFSTPLFMHEIGDVEQTIFDLMEQEALCPDVPNPVFQPTALMRATSGSNFDIDFFQIPFFNVIECVCASHRSAFDRTIWCFYVTSFAEMVLAAFALVSMPARNNRDSYLLVGSWKGPKDKPPYLWFEDTGKQRFLNKFLLGRLKRVGLLAPQEVGLTQGSLPTSSYGWFVKTCDTSGSRQKQTPLERLQTFVSGWFWHRLDMNSGKPAYDFEINFS